jgi:hypothetical protein
MNDRLYAPAALSQRTEPLSLLNRWMGEPKERLDALEKLKYLESNQNSYTS